MANEATTLTELNATKAKDPADFAYVPDKNSPSTWKLDISDPKHIAAAITALQPGGFRGQKVEIPAGDKSGVISRIRSAINKLVSDKTQKQNLLDRLDKVKSLAETGKAFQGMLPQDEVQYTPLSPKITSNQACANCRWFMRYGGCFIVQDNDPEPILPTGWCDRYEASPAPTPEPDVEPIPVMIVEPDFDDDDSAEMALPTSRRSLKELVTNVVKSILVPAPAKTVDKPFTVFKGLDGEYYWLARHTGKYVDREDEIIADHAHDEFVTRVQKGLVPMPELWTWHKKGTAHGQADFVWKSGGFVLALGHFTGTKEQKARAVKWYQEHPDTKLSHMFKFPHNGKKKNVYHAYNTVEITTLPDGVEAFPYTTYEVNEMPLTAAQLEMIRGIGGDEMVSRAQAADTKALTDTTKMDAAGIASKSAENFEGSKIPDDDESKALLTAQKDMNDRLKAVEGMPALLTALEGTIKTLSGQLTTLQTSYNAVLEKSNQNEQKLLEYQAVQPPASKSNDTLLSEREVSLISNIAKAAEPSNLQGKSLIEQMFGGAVSAGSAPVAGSS